MAWPALRGIPGEGNRIGDGEAWSDGRTWYEFSLGHEAPTPDEMNDGPPQGEWERPDRHG